MIQLKDITNTVCLNIKFIDYFYEKKISENLIQIDFELITPNRIFKYSANEVLTLWPVVIITFIQNLKLLIDGTVKEVNFYHHDMFMLFDIKRFDEPDEDGIEFMIKFPSGVYYGAESAGYIEAIIFTVNNKILVEFLIALEAELTQLLN
ncbi:hypothetical protein [Acinetobacter sp.]|uniref:hypothetical protein n=1 Tax=Acinetobacter sp. TaxID=472 RepID=UPI003B004A2C